MARPPGRKANGFVRTALRQRMVECGRCRTWGRTCGVRAQQGCVVTAQVPGSRSRPAKSPARDTCLPSSPGDRMREKVCTGIVVKKAKKGRWSWRAG